MENLRLHDVKAHAEVKKGKRAEPVKKPKPQDEKTTAGEATATKEAFIPIAEPPTQVMTRMEIDKAREDITPSTLIHRPPIKGVARELERTYPPGVRTEESRRTYDAITRSIERLLDKRGRLERGELAPQDQLFPQSAWELPSWDPQSTVTKVTVPARPQEGVKKIGQEKPPTQPSSQSAVVGAIVLAQPDKRGKKKGKKKPALKDDNSHSQPTTKAVKDGTTGTSIDAAQQPQSSSNAALPTIQLPSQAPDTWAKVVGRKERRRERATNTQPLKPPAAATIASLLWIRGYLRGRQPKSPAQVRRGRPQGRPPSLLLALKGNILMLSAKPARKLIWRT